MGQIRCRPPRALLFFAIFSRDENLRLQARERLARAFGPFLLDGPSFLFDDTTYYERSMGQGVIKEIFAVDRLIDQHELAAIKVTTNEIEVELAKTTALSVARPINIDPGMIDGAKVMLASTKNHAHRVYVDHGIFAEVTLYLREGSWESWPWTYPDYKRPAVHQFFHELKELARARLPSKEKS